MEMNVTVTQPTGEPASAPETPPDPPMQPEFQDLDDVALGALQMKVTQEVNRRRLVAQAMIQADEANRQFLRASGRASGDDWSQPEGAHDAYPLNWVVTKNGKRWRSLIAGNVWEPGTAGWREEAVDDPSTPEQEGETPAEWVQPSSAADAYNTGDSIFYQGQVYRSKIDGNVWSPTDYPAGWEMVISG